MTVGVAYGKKVDTTRNTRTKIQKERRREFIHLECALKELRVAEYAADEKFPPRDACLSILPRGLGRGQKDEQHV